MKYTIFYSWQSDTNPNFNWVLIRDCINSAVKNIENKGKLKGIFFNELQESTSNIPGSPDIVETIEERIDNCDIFICDLTITNSHDWILAALEANPDLPYKFSPNSNVYGEYNRALGNLSSDVVIAVMNTFYGNPKKNDKIIPFDARQKRFPFQYTCASEDQIDEAKSILISFFENAIRESILKLIEEERYRYLPFITFAEHRKEYSVKCEYCSNEVLGECGDSILNDDRNLRIIGISGIGKTRLVFETVKNTPEFITRYLYCDCFIDDFEEVKKKIELILRKKENPIIVLDNCNSEQAQIVIRIKRRYSSSNCKILTISNQEEQNTISGYSYINLNVDLRDVVDEIIDKKSINISEVNKKLIREFSDGIPLMALLLVESINEGNTDIGKLNNKDFVNKLIFEEKEEREIIKSCSLFRYIGFKDNFRSQIKFIVENRAITPINGEPEVKLVQFDRLFYKYKRREIVETNGRLFGIRPRPLAFALAEEWFEDCSDERMELVIKSIQDKDNPDSKILTESLCSQIKYLGDNEKVRSLIGKLTDVSGPFDNAEVVNTELGSRLFCSFVEVNPNAVADNLYRLFGSMSIEQLKNVQEGRRNLVWTLEKLCFDKNTFAKGAKLMMSFGAAENETWGNNSTNEFLNLFKIHLPGTQANLSERLEIIKWGLNKGNEYVLLSLKALNSALVTQDFTRVLGAETQGTKKLVDYYPTISEVIKYWTEVLDILEKYALSECEYSSFCSEVIAEKARGLFRTGVANIILPKIKNIAESYSYDWDLMLDSLYRIKEYEGPKLRQEYVSEIEAIIEQLTKTDFYSRFASVQKNRNKAKSNLNIEQQIKIQQEEYIKLADEFVYNYFCSSEILHSIYSKKHFYSMPFGARIAELIEGNTEYFNTFIETSLDLLLTIDSKDRNSSILIDFARGIKLEEAKNKLIESILSKEQLSYLLFPVFGVLKKEDDDLIILFSLVDKGVASIDEFIQYFNYLSLPSLPEDKFVGLCHKIKKYGIRGTDTVLSLIHSLLFFSKDVNPNSVIYGLLEDILMSIDITNLNGINRDNYFQMIDTLLSHKESKIFAKYINLQVINLAKDLNYSFSFNSTLENLYRLLIGKYFEIIWPDLSSALLSCGEDYYVYYHYQHLLGSHIGGVSNEVGILFRGDINLIFDWCNKFPEKAPVRLASMVPIFEGEGFHPITLRLINEFGNNQDVLSNLSSNMGSYSWVGSMIPLLKRKRKLFNSLKNHAIPEVADWAKRNICYMDKEIEREQQREDEERFLYS